MSDDLTIVYRRNGQDHFSYTRWGASQVGRDLMQGPASFERFVLSLPKRTEPLLVEWLCGVVLIDFDAQHVSVWAQQFAPGGAHRHKVVMRMLDVLWPGWTIRWMTDPSREVAEWLPTHVVPQNDPVRPLGVEEFERLQNEPWERARDHESTREWVELEGEAVVRSALEWETHRSIACLSDGRAAIFCDEWSCDALARTEPDALRVLAWRDQLTLQDLLYLDLESAYWIDPEARRVEWWIARPPWMDHPMRIWPKQWEGWLVVELGGGPDELVRRLGISDYLPVGPNHRSSLDDLVAGLGGPRESGADILATVVKSMDVGPGQRVHVTPPGPGDAGPELAVTAERLRSLAHEILQTTEFLARG